MKKLLLPIFLFFLMSPAPLYAEDFLGAPLVPGGKTVQKTESRLEMISQFSHDEALRFYKEALKGYRDIKFRDWKDATYIEDDGKLPWHSITISKQDKEGTNIVIMKDNWTWILGTLLLRFIGVFVVLLFLLLGMSLSGAIISRWVKKMEGKKS
ncbi:MAG: hypothetical protein JSW15_01825 [Deltaproteobacteria bacterium]|jgi:hypothetical protein|nr:MAG: hypothetical protein JSW15_01825 [Deltaproteobacteria bacterium]